MQEKNVFNDEPKKFIIEEPKIIYKGKVHGKIKQRVDGLSVASLLTGILGLVFCFCFGYLVNYLLSIAAIVTGLLSRKKSHNEINLAGLILGIVGVILSTVLWILIFLGIVSFDY